MASSLRHSQTPAQLRRTLPLATVPIFVVGAGGIGCELLKNLVLIGFRDIELIDLDTIDASNLNRQFLFKAEHVGRSKAEVAGEVLKQWLDKRKKKDDASALRIKAHHGNIKSSQYDVAFYQRFRIVVNGLDNMAARKHVNRMCMQAQVPLVESGTMGYNGQVQPIRKGRFQCYDCEPRSADQKSFAVCTIHARPTTMIHCVHYAKEFYARLFGENVAGSVAGQQQASEMAFLDHLIAEVSDPGKLTAQEQQIGDSSVAWRILEMLFNRKINELLSLKTEWTIRPPEPLKIANAQQVLLAAAAAQPNSEQQSSATSITGARDQFPPSALPSAHESTPTLEQLAALFVNATHQCVCRGRKPFDKDDSIAVNLVAACANLRAMCFHIKVSSVFEIRTMAGSIVPAIASTNAVIAAMVVGQALQILADTGTPSNADKKEGDVLVAADGAKSRIVYVQGLPISRRRAVYRSLIGGGTAKSTKVVQRDGYLLHSIPPSVPNSTCYICGDTVLPMHITLRASSHTLRSFVDLVLIKHLSFACPSINATESGHTLFEQEDFEDLADQPLTRWISSSSSSPSSTTTTTDGGNGGGHQQNNSNGNDGHNKKKATADWTIGDLYQDVEWNCHISDDPYTHGDETQFSVTKGVAAPPSHHPAAVVGSTVPVSSLDVKLSQSQNTIVGADDDDEVLIYHPKRQHTTAGGPLGSREGSVNPPSSAQVVEVEEE